MSSSRFAQQQQQAQEHSQTQPFLLRTTNASHPSIVHPKPSQQSITASEDYYSLSGSSSTYSADAPNARPARSLHPITRYQTPPERYRTPLQSTSHLPQQAETQQQAEHAVADFRNEQQQLHKTPMRGQGKRRSSVEERQAIAAAAATGPSAPSALRRKPVASTVAEQQRDSGAMSSTNARSSVARDLDRQQNAPTPDVDDTPYIHFALDQLTRDEEVRGSRRYVGGDRDRDGAYPYLTPLQVHQQQRALEPQRPAPVQQSQSASPQRRPAYQALSQDDQIDPELEQQQSVAHSPPPPRNPSRQSQVVEPLRPLHRPQGPNLLVPVLSSRDHPLRFIPGTLRPLRLALFALVLLAYLVCLIIAAAWSRADTGLTGYGSFGDSKYFLFRYLPTLLGMLLLFWLIHIEIAVYRIAPFMAMASNNPRARAAGANLPLQPRGFVLPYFGHFKAAQPLAGLFLLVCWFQLFTIPLLASSFNVYFSGAPATGRWMWIAVQGAIWTVIALYILLFLALCGLFAWIRRCRSTGLKWDPRTLADLIVLLERSNALDGSSSAEVPRLGQWHTTHRPNEIFHTFGVADKSPRSYAIDDDGRIREKLPTSSPTHNTQNRYSDPMETDVEAQRPLSKEAMLPRAGTDASYGSDDDAQRGNVLPWFLRPSMALLWPVASIILLLAFLIVSYLPSTDILRGFLPMVPSIVDKLGFSAGNFLYSFVPATLALLCVLVWLNIDMAYRRLQPLASLAQINNRRTRHATVYEKAPSSSHDRATTYGDIPDRTLLTSYPASAFPFTPLLALANSHYRVAYLAAVTLLSCALPVLAGGCFWAQFDISAQRVRIYVQLAAYYALSVFVTVYALSYLATYPDAALRTSHGVHNNDKTNGDVAAHIGRVESFNDICRLLARSQLLDDLAFHGAKNRIDLVTRLLAASPATALRVQPSTASLKDSLRGFALARAAAERDARLTGGISAGQGGAGEVSEANARYAFLRCVGRDGGIWWGVDRVRS